MHRGEIDERVHENEADLPTLMDELWGLVRRRISAGKRMPCYPVLQGEVILLLSYRLSVT